MKRYKPLYEYTSPLLLKVFNWLNKNLKRFYIYENPDKKGYPIIFETEDNNTGELGIFTDGEMLYISHFMIENKGTGLGEKIIRELINFSNKYDVPININKAYNSFWKKFGFTPTIYSGDFLRYEKI